MVSKEDKNHLVAGNVFGDKDSFDTKLSTIYSELKPCGFLRLSQSLT